jgi:quinol monooxygenase YgiN
MTKKLLAIVCVITLLPSCSNTSNQAVVGKTCDCAANKDSMEIVMNNALKVKPEYVSAYKEALEICRIGSIQEETCLDYELFQSNIDSTEFILFERWKNIAGHRAHLQTAHYIKKAEDIKIMSDTPKKKSVVTYVCPCVNP